MTEAEEYYRRCADDISDTEFRELGMSAHELLRVRSLQQPARYEAISASMLSVSRGGLTRRAMKVWLSALDRSRILDD